MDFCYLDCIQEEYMCKIYLQQASYATIQENYNYILGNNTYVMEAEKETFLSRAKSTLKEWIQKIINFITKTIPEFVKKVLNKLKNIMKKRKNVEEVKVSANTTIVNKVESTVNKSNKAKLLMTTTNNQETTQKANEIIKQSAKEIKEIADQESGQTKVDLQKLAGSVIKADRCVRVVNVADMQAKKPNDNKIKVKVPLPSVIQTTFKNFGAIGAMLKDLINNIIVSMTANKKLDDSDIIKINNAVEKIKNNAKSCVDNYNNSIEDVYMYPDEAAAIAEEIKDVNGILKPLENSMTVLQANNIIDNDMLSHCVSNILSVSSTVINDVVFVSSQISKECLSALTNFRS